MTTITAHAGSARMAACLRDAEALGFTRPGTLGQASARHESGLAEIALLDAETTVRVHLYAPHTGRHPLATGYVDLASVDPDRFRAVLAALVGSA